MLMLYDRLRQGTVLQISFMFIGRKRLFQNRVVNQTQACKIFLRRLTHLKAEFQLSKYMLHESSLTILNKSFSAKYNP